MLSASGKTLFPTRKSSGWIKTAFSPFRTSFLPSWLIGCARKWRRCLPSKALANRGCRKSAQTCKTDPLPLMSALRTHVYLRRLLMCLGKILDLSESIHAPICQGAVTNRFMLTTADRQPNRARIMSATQCGC